MSGFELDVDFFMEELDRDERVVQGHANRAVSKISTVANTVTVTRQGAEARRDYLTRKPEDWDWNDLRNYVVAKIEERDRALRIPIPVREERKEFGIFSSFWGRHEAWAGPIAKFAFETSSTPGYWKSAPISITRFCMKSDPWFAVPILERIRPS